MIDMSRDDCKGLTLVELLITTGIVGMVMLGIVSIDYALRTNERQQTRAGLVAMRTSAMMFDMTSTLSQAEGLLTAPEGTLSGPPDQCIKMGNMTANNTNYICAYSFKGTTADTSDDTWTCYTKRTTNLHKCSKTVGAGPGACTAADLILGTVTSDTWSALTDVVLTVNRATKTFTLQWTLKNRYDPTSPSVAGAAYGAVYPQDYLTNPKFTMTSQVMPRGCTL